MGDKLLLLQYFLLGSTWGCSEKGCLLDVVAQSVLEVQMFPSQHQACTSSGNTFARGAVLLDVAFHDTGPGFPEFHWSCLCSIMWFNGPTVFKRPQRYFHGVNNGRGTSEEQQITHWTCEPTTCCVTLDIFAPFSALAASITLHWSSLFRSEPVPLRKLYIPSVVTCKLSVGPQTVIKVINFSLLLMLFVRFVCKPSRGALVVFRVLITGQINTMCSTVGPASPTSTVPLETKDLQQGLQEEKPFFCHWCHNSAQLIYCFLSPSLQFQSYRGPVLVHTLWLGDLNQDQSLSSASKGGRSGFIRNSMWAFWAKPILWVPLPLLAGRMRCAAMAGTLSWALQSQARSGHRLGLQGAQHPEWVERERQPNKEWIKHFTF